MSSNHERFDRPTRRQFFQVAGGAAGALLGGSAAFAHHHGKPTPQSLPYLDQRMYFHNMELIAHVPPSKPGTGRGAGQMMAIGGQRLLFSSGDVIDVSDPRNPTIISRGGAVGGDLVYNAQLKKWIVMQSSQVPYFAAEFPGGKYDDPTIVDQFRKWEGLRGIRLHDASDPTKIVELGEFSTGQTGSGPHGDASWYDGGKYAYLDVAPDDTYTGMLDNLVPLANSLMVVDVSDPGNIKEVSRWHVPGQRAGMPGETQELKKWKCLQGRGAEMIPDRPLTMEEATKIFRNLRYPAFDRFPYTMSHGASWVPKKVEDGGRYGYGSWSAFGMLVHDFSDITKPSLAGRFDPAPTFGLDGIPFHTVWLPTLDRGFVVGISEALNPDCNESWLPCWVIDVRDPKNPVPISMLPRPKAPSDAPFTDFCYRRGRFSAHRPADNKAPGRASQTFLPLEYFNAGLRCYDLSEPTAPTEVAWFVPPMGGTLSEACRTDEGYNPANPDAEECWRESLSYNRPCNSVQVEWDRKILYAGTTTGLYILSTPALGKPMLEAMPVVEWSMPGLNVGAP
jgi:hypothetical protein